MGKFGEWMPIETAPKDGTWIWAILKPNSKRYGGRSFQVRHEGKTPTGLDLGWSLFPGYGGVPTSDFAGWMPLPEAP